MNSKYIDQILFVLWCTLFLYLCHQHIPWRDEYQSWLVSTRTKTFSEFILAVRYERHPPFLYILQRGLFFALKPLSLSVSTQFYFSRWLCWIASACTAFIILFKLPLDKVTRRLMPFGYFFIFEYGIITRDYIFGILFIFFGYYLYQSKKEKLSLLALFLSASSHLFFTWISFALWLIFLFKKHFDKKSSSNEKLFKILFYEYGMIFIFGISLMVLFQIPPPNSAFASGVSREYWNVFRIFEYIGQAWLGIDHIWGPFVWNRFPIQNWGSALLIPVIWLWVRSGFLLRYFLFMTLLPLLVMCLVYAPGMRHTGVLWIAAILTLMLSEKLKPRGKAIFILFLIIQIFGTVRLVSAWKPWREDTIFAFSGSKELVDFNLMDRLDTKAVIVTDTEALFFPLMVYTSWQIFDVKRDDFVSYPTFLSINYKYNLEEWCKDRLTHFFDQMMSSDVNPSIYLAVQKDFPIPLSCNVGKRVFVSYQNIVTDEKYSVYTFLSKER